ncbi:TetR family transcriptional regulator [Janibacter cremeus]|uniref:TetR/AcrR family transcriptional regulator n=1 Tax=Janibacter cremeus TaxID=1285192 RepID=UPI0023FA3FCA|nr:TetR/AcrR family transcriptional regulator [Janibacter cremeus]WEV77488.1 TetR family transcriptional regulator [Janibacter cremeus]
MSSVDDRTARARVRDAALELFAEHGEDAVTMRQIAERADVSAALVVHHFGSKAGLREAVVEHVRDRMDELFDLSSDSGLTGEWSSIAEVLQEALPEGSPVIRYLRRLMMTGDPLATELLAAWHRRTVEIFRAWDDAGVLLAGPDPQTRAALAMSADLGTLLLADHWQQVLGYDPLHGDGLARWADEAMRVYAAILPTPDTGTDTTIGAQPPSSKERP